MYKLYSLNGQIVVEKDGLTVYVVPVDSARLQVIQGTVYLYDLFNRANSFGVITNELGPVSNITGADGRTFSTEEELYDYYVSMMVTVEVDPSGNIVSESGSAGFVSATLVRPADSSAYASGDVISSDTVSPSPVVMDNMATFAGGGGYITQLNMETDISTFANTTVRAWFVTDPSVSLTGDNLPLTISYGDAGKRLFYVDVTFDGVMPGSSSVFGSSGSLFQSYVTVGGNDLYVVLQAMSSVTPYPSGSITVNANIIKL